MKANHLEVMIVNSPIRLLVQRKILLPWIRKHVSLPSHGTFLEIGCGRGAGACLLLEEFFPEAVHAMDLDENMISEATRYITPEQREKINLYVGDSFYLPHRDASMDAVFGFGVLHHLPDWQGGVKEIARVLKPRGIYFLEEFYPPFYLNFLVRRLVVHPEENRFYSRDLRENLKEAGLPITNALDLKAIGIIAVCRKLPATAQ
jgi:ubiquinone/menaquinone biosynthesis C-methylase UbiE